MGHPDVVYPPRLDWMHYSLFRSNGQFLLPTCLFVWFLRIIQTNRSANTKEE